jgi:hypothetical protein
VAGALIAGVVLLASWGGSTSSAPVVAGASSSGATSATGALASNDPLGTREAPHDTGSATEVEQVGAAIPGPSSVSAAGVKSVTPTPRHASSTPKVAPTAKPGTTGDPVEVFGARR